MSKFQIHLFNETLLHMRTCSP